jgi:preprotein translocase subunit YajC
MEALLALFFTFGLMWLLLIRPQQRRMRAHQAVVSALEPGDEVVTAGGIHGTILSVADDIIHLEVAPGVVLRVLRGAITQQAPPEREPEDELDDEFEDEFDGEDEDEPETKEAGVTRPRAADEDS